MPVWRVFPPVHDSSLAGDSGPARLEWCTEAYDRERQVSVALKTLRVVGVERALFLQAGVPGARRI